MPSKVRRSMKCTVWSSCVPENFTMIFSVAVAVAVAVAELGFEVRVGQPIFFPKP
jgi:hypothetical protein